MGRQTTQREEPVLANYGLGYYLTQRSAIGLAQLLFVAKDRDFPVSGK